MHLHQERAVCSQSTQRDVTQLLAAVGGILLQAWAVRSQGGHPVVVNPPAIRDVNLCHVLPPRSYFHQEIVVYLGNKTTPKGTKISTETKVSYLQ